MNPVTTIGERNSSPPSPPSSMPLKPMNSSAKDTDLMNDLAFHNHHLTVNCIRKDAIGGNGTKKTESTTAAAASSAATTTPMNLSPTNNHFHERDSDKLEIAKDLRLSTKLHNDNPNNGGNVNTYTEGNCSTAIDTYNNHLENHISHLQPGHIDYYKNTNINQTRVGGNDNDNCKEKTSSSSSSSSSSSISSLSSSAATTTTVTTSTTESTVALNSFLFSKQQQLGPENASDLNFKASRTSSKKSGRKNSRKTEIEQQQNNNNNNNSNNLLTSSQLASHRTSESPDKSKCYEEVSQREMTSENLFVFQLHLFVNFISFCQQDVRNRIYYIYICSGYHRHRILLSALIRRLIY